jgi:hypothetical protein
MVLFSADLSEDVEGFNISFTPTNDASRNFNVYEAYLGQYPVSSYWIDWGGWYDNTIANQVEIYIGGRYLTRVYSLDDCKDTDNSLYDNSEAGTIYINVSKHTWLYDDAKADYRKVISFLSGPKNPKNPSDDLINNEHWPVKLEVPKITVKLSDVINGLTKYSTFDFTLFNDDGYFDNMSAFNFFNAPTYIKKTWKENPGADDFIPIRYGIVESIKLNENTMTVSCADIFRTLEEPVSKSVKDLFPSAVENQDEELPVVYGIVNMPLIKIDEGKYVIGEDVWPVLEVYDKDGNPVTGWTFDDGVLSYYGEEDIESARVAGKDDNTLGRIVVDIISLKTKITYTPSFWDIDETNEYLNTAPAIKIAFTGGTVREAVKDTLASDMVFLIQKNDGRFTLREWGKTYNTFNVKSWQITQFPQKDFAEAQKGYFSSCLIRYNKNFVDNDYQNVYLYTDGEAIAESQYNKKTRKEFETCLTNENNAKNLAVKLYNRFSTLRETVKVSVGFDTSEINLLDTVNLELKINGRVFSEYTQWIVKEIDPAQDILTLEPVS